MSKKIKIRAYAVAEVKMVRTFHIPEDELEEFLENLELQFSLDSSVDDLDGFISCDYDIMNNDN